MNLELFGKILNFASYLDSHQISLFNNSNYSLFIRRVGADFISITKAGPDEISMPPMEDDGRRISTFNLNYSDFVNHNQLTGYRKEAFANLVGNLETEKVGKLIGDYNQPFKPVDVDMRKRRIVNQTTREGQHNFREDMLTIYEDTCVVTGCKLVSVLEAAHITPYNGTQSNHPQNGLIFRSDIHILFDLYLLTIDPSSMQLRLSEKLEGSEYWNNLRGNPLKKIPKDIRIKPSEQALALHYEEFLSRNSVV
jgi:hypothetical protein